MVDAFDNDLKIGDNVVYMYQHYDGRWDSFHKGKIIGFTPCFVKIQIDEEDKDKYWAKQFIYLNGNYNYVSKPYIMRQPHKVIKMN